MTVKNEFDGIYPGAGIERITIGHRSAREALDGLGSADVYVIRQGLVIREKGASTATLVSVGDDGRAEEGKPNSNPPLER